MNAEIIPAGRNDGRERRPLGPVLPQRIVEHSLILIFIHPRPGSLHHGHDAVPGNLLRFPHRRYLTGLLDGAQLAQDSAGILDPQERIVHRRPSAELMGRRIPVPRLRPVTIQIQAAVIPQRSHPVEIRLERVHVRHIPNAGKLRRLIRLDPCPRPALLHRIRRQDINPLPRPALRILPGQQNELLAVQSCQIQEIPVRIEGILLIVGLADLRP